MAPPRKHKTDDILDAARAQVLAEGPRATTVAAIAEASGAPVGTLYHRFGSRDGVLAAAWLRALERFQAGVLAADEAHPDDPVEAGVAMAVTSLAFASEHPEDARLLLVIRRSDLLDGSTDESLQAQLDSMNAPLLEALNRIADAIYGHTGVRAIDAITRAVVDLPTAAVRRHVRKTGDRLPEWLEEDVADATRRLLTRRRHLSHPHTL